MTSPSGTQLHELSALEVADAIRAGEVTALEVTVDSLERAEKLGATVGAFTHLAHQRALTTAASLDANPSLAKGSRLRGVPCPIKDLSMVRGLPLRAGSAALDGDPAPVDDGIVTLLAGAGTVMTGKTSTPEFGLPCYTEPEGQPAARTPWDLSRGAGGSSGGAAAAVSAGIVPIAHGSDGGGSIRIPASCCGLVGLKPSRGRVSPGPHGVDGVALASHGVLTRTVRDTAAGLDVLSGRWPGDQYLLPETPGGFLQALDTPPPSLRIGLLTTPSNVDTTVHPACLRAAERAARLLEELGHHVEQAPSPYAPERWAAFIDLWSVMALSAPVPDGREGQLRPLTRWLRGKGREVAGVEHARALMETQRLTREVATTWADFDVVLTPTLAQPPALVGELRHDDDPERDFWHQTAFTPWSSTANLTGRASISLPLHRERIDGVELPIGVMLTGTMGGDEILLRLAAQLEAADPWPRTPIPPAGQGG
ncbi:amidase family protein [Luteococcus sp. H138]|uniref:amidase n=1 Tax=unclassified Luteococcus TaxID=2639923 RepID=UPI00313AA95E